MQKVNQGLEDKLLRVVDKFESEKSALTRDVASLTQRLVDARFNVTRLQEENVSVITSSYLIFSMYLTVYFSMLTSFVWKY